MSSVDKILIVFLDGVGLGDDGEANPLANHPLPFLTKLLAGHKLLQADAALSNDQVTLVGLDATLGVLGLPQSGTGQTAILTGLNAPRLLGEHYGPYPNQYLKDCLAKHSIFTRLQTLGKPVAYAGAYPDHFHNRLRRGKGRLSANTRAAVSAGLKLRGPSDLQSGRAVSGLLTNHYWREWGYDMPLLTPQQAGAQLVRLAEDYALTYFEFWHTDAVGHKQDQAQAYKVLTLLDAFFKGIYQTLNAETTLFLIISDHGNFENLATKHHTDNPALTLAMGKMHQSIQDRKKTMDIASFVLATLSC